MRTLAIGDMHGCFDALAALLEIVGPAREDTLITLGDYIDRGPQSRQVIDRLIELSGVTNLIPLMGNHEIMMLRAREDRSAIPQWLYFGGNATLDSYGDEGFSDIPEAHWQFLKTCRRYHETAGEFFVHANAFPDTPLDEQPDIMLFWEHLRGAEPHESGRRMICGHTTQRSGLPLNFGHTVCIDTCVHGSGWLSCLDVGANHLWQANQKGETRELDLAE